MNTIQQDCKRLRIVKGRTRCGRFNRLSQAALIAASGVAASYLASSAFAATYTWDPSANGVGSNVGGTWNITTSQWATGTGDVAWPNTGTDTAVFGTGSGAGFKVTVAATSPMIGASGISFSPVTGGQYTLAGAGNVTNASTIATSSGDLSITVASGVTATIATSLTIWNGNVTVSGGGTLIQAGSIGDPGSSSSIRVGSGTTFSIASVVNSNHINPFGSGSGGVQLYGGTFQYTGVAASSNGFAKLIVATTNGAFDDRGSGFLAFNVPITAVNDSASGHILTLTGTGGNIASLTGVISNSSTGNRAVQLAVNGATTYQISNGSTANTYTGGTTVAAGELDVMGGTSSTGTGGVTVASGAYIGGTGTVGTGALSIASGGYISPGTVSAAGLHADGILTTANLGMANGSKMHFNLNTPNDTAGGQNGNDLVLVGGSTLTLNNNVVLEVESGASFDVGKYYLIDYANTTTTNVTQAMLNTWTVSGVNPATYTFGIGTDPGNAENSIYVNFTVVPEPTSIAMLAIGGSMALMRKRCRRSNAAPLYT